MHSYDPQLLREGNPQVLYQEDENKLQMPLWRIVQERRALQKPLKPNLMDILIE